ncbi:MAG TPA: hypothetical protein VFR97_02020 [Capillimicrobium sp.]|nr:hypothetical protein [Capillimicrobium sp.]
MRANRRLEVRHRRGSWLPAWLASPGTMDHIEIVEIETAETVMFWDRERAEAARMARALQADLAQLEVEDFLAKWSAIAPEDE